MALIFALRSSFIPIADQKGTARSEFRIRSTVESNVALGPLVDHFVVLKEAKLSFVKLSFTA